MKFTKFFKDLLLAIPISLIIQPIIKTAVFLNYFNKLILWIYRNKNSIDFNDFYTPIRNYNKRFKLYEYLVKQFQLSNTSIVYLEFGVASGASFKWWLNNNFSSDSIFCGFDTFEGLPEDWGSFQKGDMSSPIPVINDSRGEFIKGLFQDTLTDQIHKIKDVLQSDRRRVVHMDADLYTSTAFTLSQLYPYFKKGDIIFFDEFSVAMHEFKAYDEFVNNFYIKLTPVAAVNNFYQTAFIVS